MIRFARLADVAAATNGDPLTRWATQSLAPPVRAMRRLAAAALPT